MDNRVIVSFKFQDPNHPSGEREVRKRVIPGQPFINWSDPVIVRFLEDDRACKLTVFIGSGIVDESGEMTANGIDGFTITKENFVNGLIVGKYSLADLPPGSQ